MAKLVRYSWTITGPGKNVNSSVQSQRLPAEAIDNCLVYVQFIRVTNDSCHLTVLKTNLIPIKASISIKINEGASQTKQEEWKHCCRFFDCYCSNNETVKISCNITWTLPEAPATIKDLPTGLALPAENFLMSTSLSDVTIVIGKEELPAHQLILSGYSSVFRQMLANPMKESETNRITIEDIDVDTMKTVLTFLYKGKCKGLSEVPVACKVLAAAHKYDLQYLYDTCVHYLQQQVNAKNVVEILELAELYGNEQLKQVCWDFVMKNKKDIMISDQFKDLCMASRGVIDQFIAEVVKASP